MPVGASALGSGSTAPSTVPARLVESETPPGSDQESASDRRAHARIEVMLEVDYRAADTFLFAYITDISAMGIFVRTAQPEPPGTHLWLRFTPASGEEA